MAEKHSKMIICNDLSGVLRG